MKKILILGGAGTMGSEATKLLLERSNAKLISCRLQRQRLEKGGGRTGQQGADGGYRCHR